MVCRLVAVSLFLENRGEGHKTGKRASVTVNVTFKWRAEIVWDRTKNSCFRLSTSTLLAAHGIVARTSCHLTLTVTFPRLLVLRSSHGFLRKRETLLQYRYMDYRPRRISINSQKEKKTEASIQPSLPTCIWQLRLQYERQSKLSCPTETTR